MKALVVILAVAASAPAIQRLEIGRTDSGYFFWHGHRIAPPYVGSVGYRVSGGDTTWVDTYINGLTLESLRPIPKPRPAGSLDPEKMAEAMKSAIEGATKDKKDGATDPYVVLLARRYQAYGDLIDSVTMVSGTELLIHWRGISKPMGVTVGGSEIAPPRVPTSGLGLARTVDGVIRSLSEGRAIVLSNGMLTAPDPGRLLPEIDSLQAGLNPSTHWLGNAARDEFLHPQPLDSLKARAKTGT